MISDTTKAAACSVDGLLFDNWFDPIEAALRDRVRNFIEELFHGELTAALDRPRYGRRGPSGRPRSPCRAPGLRVRTARRRSGRARRCGPTSAARWLLTP